MGTDVGDTTSLMERLYALSSVYGSEADHVLHCRMMDVQYRMPPVIGDAISRLFYNGLLRSRVGLDLERSFLYYHNQSFMILVVEK